MSMKVLIVEDETFAMTNIKSILRELEPSIDVVAGTESIIRTVEWLRQNPAPDLIFMDIHLADGSAFNIFRCIDVEAPVIFTTAYDEYAIEAFKVNSIDYLLKPLKKDDVRRALEKFRKFNTHDTPAYIGKITGAINTDKHPESLIIPVRDKLRVVKTTEIAFIYTSGDDTLLGKTDGETLPLERSLDTIYKSLNPKIFYRANRRFIISRDVIKDITVWLDSRLLINIGTDTPERIFISKNKASEFKEWLIRGH